MMPDYIPPALGLPLAAILWTIWAIVAIRTRKTPMNTTARKLTTSQVADLFGVNRFTVQRWADEGKLPCTRTLGGARRFDADTIARKLDEA